LKGNAVTSKGAPAHHLDCRISDIPSKSIRHKKNCKKLRAANKTFTAKSAEQTGSKGTTSGYVSAGQGRWKKCKAKPEDDENHEGTDGVAESAY
jgi:hypothetical protein